MAFRSRLSDNARAELLSLYDWIEAINPGQADRWLRGLEAQIETLATFPNRCPISEEGRRLGRPIRILLYGRKHRMICQVLFEVVEDGVEIVSIRHAARRGE